MAGFPVKQRFFFPCYFPAETAVGEVKERLGELETSQRRWRRRQGLRDVQLELLQEKQPVRGFNTKSIWLRGAITLCVLAEADGCCLPGHRGWWGSRAGRRPGGRRSHHRQPRRPVHHHDKTKKTTTRQLDEHKIARNYGLAL